MAARPAPWDRDRMTTTRTSRRTGTAAFTVATAVALMHALDDAFAHRGPGVGLGQHVLAAVLSLVLGLGAIYAFPRLRPGLRATIAFVFGTAALVNGGMHLTGGHLSGGDFTGVLAAVAGVVLIGLAFINAWRAHWVSWLVALPLTFFVAIPLGMGIAEVHKPREAVGPTPAGYRDVAFDASDGVRISGWYRPTRNGATLVVLHGGGSDRKGAMAHARMLVRHGYGVLAYDSRGRGRSEGVQNSYGWGWSKDVEGAVAFLKTRPEVDPARIGGLGLSSGADALVEAAGLRRDLRAVVADGTAAMSFEDTRRVDGAPAVMTPFFALEFATVRVASGGEPGPAMEDMIKRSSAPTLLVSAGRDLEYEFSTHYDRVAGEKPVEHWNLPDATHTRGLRQAGPEYERRVTAFLDSALLR